MSGARWTINDLIKKGLAQVDGKDYRNITQKPPKIAKPGEGKVNRKVMGATKETYNGIQFSSKLEAYLYKLLEASGIAFDCQVVYVVQEGFKYGTEAVRPIKCIVDFSLPECNLIIDTKGFSTDVSKLKYKLLKHHLYQQGLFIRIEMPRTKADCEALISRIKYTDEFKTNTK